MIRLTLTEGDSVLVREDFISLVRVERSSPNPCTRIDIADGMGSWIDVKESVDEIEDLLATSTKEAAQ